MTQWTLELKRVSVMLSHKRRLSASCFPISIDECSYAYTTCRLSKIIARFVYGKWSVSRFTFSVDVRKAIGSRANKSTGGNRVQCKHSGLLIW